MNCDDQHEDSFLHSNEWDFFFSFLLFILSDLNIVGCFDTCNRKRLLVIVIVVVDLL